MNSNVYSKDVNLITQLIKDKRVKELKYLLNEVKIAKAIQDSNNDAFKTNRKTLLWNAFIILETLASAVSAVALIPLFIFNLAPLIILAETFIIFSIALHYNGIDITKLKKFDAILKYDRTIIKNLIDSLESSDELKNNLHKMNLNEMFEYLNEIITDCNKENDKQRREAIAKKFGSQNNKITKSTKSNLTKSCLKYNQEEREM